MQGLSELAEDPNGFTGNGIVAEDGWVDYPDKIETVDDDEQRQKEEDRHAVVFDPNYEATQ